MIDILNELKKKVTIGFVGGSDYSKVHEQLGESIKTIMKIMKKNK